MKKPASDLVPGDVIVFKKVKGTVLRGPRTSPRFTPGYLHFEVKLPDGVYNFKIGKDEEVNVLKGKGK